MWLEQIVYNAVGSRLIAAEDYYDAGVKYMEFARYKEAIECRGGKIRQAS